MNRHLTELPMGTVEIIIVFSALMALIALVTVGIDWIGKPLKHRRFIPRIYRFDDEKLPTDAYGHTTLEAAPTAPAMMASPPLPYVQPTPVVVANVPTMPHQPAAAEQTSRARIAVQAKAAKITKVSTGATVGNVTQAPPRQVASVDASVLAGAGASAFSSTLAEPEAAPKSVAGTRSAGSPLSSSDTEWRPGMALDATIQDRKPNLATKAERFWMASAESLHDSHFDGDDLARMATGKAPRRTNPRTGRVESIHLTGLRQASSKAEVRMRWPDESVDPWNA